MAGLNRMGPMNLGSRTGRGMGVCSPNNQGGRFQTGFGMGRGRGMGRGFYSYNFSSAPTQEESLLQLKRERDYLNQMIQNLEKSDSDNS